MPEISYGKIVIEALRKDAFSRRSLPMIGALIITAIFIFKLVVDLIFNLQGISDVPFDKLRFLLFFLELFLVSMIAWVLTLFFGAIVIKQAGEDAKGVRISLTECFWLAVQQFKTGRKKTTNKALRPKRSETLGNKGNYRSIFWFVKTKMLSLVCAGILIALIPSVIGTGLSIVPYAGGLLNLIVSILIALSVFVTYPYIILEERGAINAISASFHHFIENKLQISIMWVLRTAIALVITVTFAIPFIIVFSLFIFPRLPLQGVPPPYLLSTTSVIVITAIAIVILAIGLSIAMVFSYGVSARYYNVAIGRIEEGGNEGDEE
jgi:hypothetical protein